MRRASGCWLALTFAGGLARLFSLVLGALPSIGHLGGIGMELVVVPLLVLWQARIAAAVPGERNGAIVRRLNCRLNP